MVTRVPPITARGDHKELLGTSDNDDLVIAGVARALAGGDVLIDLLEGNDTLEIYRTAAASGAGTVDIQAHGGNNAVTIRDISALGGKVNLAAAAGDDVLTVRGNIAVSLRGAENGSVDIGLGDGNNKITIARGLQAQGGEIDLLTGDGSDAISFVSAAVSRGGNISIETGNGDDQITSTRGLQASGGEISFVTGDGSDVISFAGATTSQGGKISIETGNGDDQITSTRGLQATNGEISLVTGDGNDAISFVGATASQGGGKISIETGNGDDQITSTSGLQASRGEISLDTGSGNDSIFITGAVRASNGGSVSIETGDGNDMIQLQGPVQAGALTIDAGEGTDTLVLISSGPQQFGQYYQNLLSDNGGIHGMGVENLIVAFYQNTTGISRLQGLADMVAATPGSNLLLHIDSMGIRGGLGSGGRDINLANIFDTGPDVFDKIIMSGSHNNTLAIRGSLDSNNYAGNQLVIIGDEKDTVKLSSDWIDSGLNIGDYEVFNNAGDALLIQHQIQVLVG